ncbi:YecA family protein [Vibrio breoganii]
MKIGRNDPCPCNSGKKYKRCCMNQASHQEVLSDIEQIAAMNPDLSLDDLNTVLQHKIQAQNERPLDDFCGLSSTQMSNWLYAPWDALQEVTISTPSDLSSSPVMRYLELMLEEAIQNSGAFKATAKGNLPTKLVKAASTLLPEFAVSQFDTPISISHYTGANEDKFSALHYTRVLAEIAGILYHRSGQWHVKKAAQNRYHDHGLCVFFKPMLEAMVTQYNWGYLDGFSEDTDLRLFWRFMVWRLQSHRSVKELSEELIIAFPDILLDLAPNDYRSVDEQMHDLIELRFIERFLQYWGFVTINPRCFDDAKHLERLVSLQPLWHETFHFQAAMSPQPH